jgi:hypothetical protein
MIADPFSGRTMLRMFSTHPDTAGNRRLVAEFDTRAVRSAFDSPGVELGDNRSGLELTGQTLRRDAGQVGGPHEAGCRTQLGDPQLGQRPVAVASQRLGEGG